MRRLLLLLATLAMAMLVASPAAVGQQDLDCKDFASQADAQAELRSNPSDPNNLDAEDDGVACETYPYPEGTPRDETPVPPAQSPVGDSDCEDFATQAKAQQVFNQDPSDPNNLDSDNDGIACEDFFGGSGEDQYAEETTVIENTVEIVNIPDKDLPKTGGHSVSILPAGALLIGSGIVLLSIARRR